MAERDNVGDKSQRALSLCLVVAGPASQTYNDPPFQIKPEQICDAFFLILSNIIAQYNQADIFYFYNTTVVINIRLVFPFRGVGKALLVFHFMYFC